MAKNIDETLNSPNLSFIEGPYTDHGEFKVPEGYFETLQQSIMANIPKENISTKKKPLILCMPVRLRYAVAACLTGLVVCGGVMTFNATQNNNAVAASSSSSQTTYTSDNYVQDCMDYAMVDDGDVYNYLTDQSKE